MHAFKELHCLQLLLCLLNNSWLGMYLSLHVNLRLLLLH
jgi:hypothetical protein